MKNKSAGLAVVLLSGGLDSATVLYLAKAKGYLCRCLIFNYGQLHKKEIIFAVKIARVSRSSYEILKIGFPWRGSALLDKKVKIPTVNTQINNSLSSNDEINFPVPAMPPKWLREVSSVYNAAGTG